ncbi:MAG: hypothetical protein ACE5FO_10815 [Parvularculaceae bacterium]
MNVKRFALSVVAVYVAYAIMAMGAEYLFKAQLESLEAIYRPTAERDSLMAVMLLGYLLNTVMFCYIFVKGREGKGLAEGARYGLMIGLLYAGIDIAWHSYLPITATTTIVWVLVDVVMAVVAGVVLAAVYKPEGASKAAPA